jgi:hypothetical protein
MKIVNITIPDDKIIDISGFSLEENYMMLKIGSECLLEGRKAVAGLTQKDIYNKIKEETRGEVQRLELDILVEREMKVKMEEQIKNMYENMLEKMRSQIETMSVQIKSYELQNKDLIKAEVDKARERYDLVLNEKDKQINRLSETYEKLIIQSHKSTSHKGSDGEKTFSDYAETFIDFKGFEIIDKHTQGGQGDFHLHFEDFDVLVDAKNYKKKVPIDQREKIKNDLQKNEHLHFAWLVSLNTSIDKFDKSPIMYDWINTKQCIVYINNLSSFEDPKKILRIVWFTCKELYDMTKDVNFDEEELTKLKNDRFKMMDKIRVFRKNIREINTSMNATRNLIQVMDDELKTMLDNETNEIVSSNFSLFDNWWNENIIVTNDDSIVVSTDLWFRFKQENKDIIKDFEITPDKFRQFVKSKVSMSSITIKNKNVNSAFDIKGMKLKVFNYKSNIIENEKIDIELNEEVLKKPKIIKKTPEIVFSKELDSKLLNEYYSNKDIMEISEKNNIKPWQVVSLLMKYNIIKKRDDARGYDKYKETEEYKQKLEKK